MRQKDLDLGTSAHYLSAEYYDRLYRRYDQDIPFYVQTALELGASPSVLELGCGTGRVTLPLARAGCRVTGVDAHETMLAGARGKLAFEHEDVASAVTLLCDDMRWLELGQRYRLVIAPFNALQHLYGREDIERALAAVRAHLMPRAGRFVFDVLVPDPGSLSRDPTKRYRLGKAYHPAGRKRYLYREAFDYDPVSQVQTITMFFDDPHDPAGSFETPLAHRQLYPAELEALLHYNGFRILSRYGNFDRSPLDEASESQIYVCALAPQRQAL